MATTGYGAQAATLIQRPSDNVMDFNQNRKHYYNYNNNTRARVERDMDAEQKAATDAICYGDIAQTFADSIGRPMPRVIEREIAAMMERGIQRGLILAVLEYTAGAPRPSWAYARAVIQRNHARGICSGLEFEESIGMV